MDPFEPELAGVAEHNVAGLGDVLIELQAEAGITQQASEQALAAQV